MKLVFLIAMATASEIGDFTGAPCGLNGRIEERIADCSTNVVQFDHKHPKWIWSLVTRTQDGDEVWKDELSGRLWGDLWRTPMTRAGALMSCSISSLNNSSTGFLPKVLWRLPTKGEYLWADRRNIREVLPHMKGYIFWTESYFLLNPGSAWVFEGNNGLEDGESVENSYSVRCIGKPPQENPKQR